MGSIIGGRLAQAGNDVTLVDVVQPVVDVLNSSGLRIESKDGTVATIPIKATTQPASVGVVDLVLVFVKCYHTEAAIKAAAPLIGPATKVLSLQNGWGNGPRLAGIVGEERVLLGVCYHSANVLGPGRIKHGGQGPTHLGAWRSKPDGSVGRIAETFKAAGLETHVAADVVKEIWSKLALNICTLPTAALLRLEAGQLIQHPGVVDLMAALLKETVAIAHARQIPLDYHERWEAITGLLKRIAPGAKPSMLQDVEARRRTEIDVINGAIVAAGRELNIATPHNDDMVWMVQSLENTFK